MLRGTNTILRAAERVRAIVENGIERIDCRDLSTIDLNEFLDRISDRVRPCDTDLAVIVLSPQQRDTVEADVVGLKPLHHLWGYKIEVEEEQ